MSRKGEYGLDKLWGGRFTKATDALVEQYTASIPFDHRLYEEDIQGSIAHVRMLGAQHILPAADVETIVTGLRAVYAKLSRGDVAWDVADEDIHMCVEKMLIAEVGAVGGKLHTGRSRNDQVATDMHLYLRKRVHTMVGELLTLQQALCDQAHEHVETIVPGYTHLQRAQPLSLAHHWLAYVEMFGRDTARLIDAYKRIDVLPLGAGALAGTTFPIDRMAVATQLGFAHVYENSLDAVSDRDFIVEFLAATSLTMTHLSRLCEELVLWSSTEFGFIELDDAFCTGSSIMPQKKNPDVAELVRGKTGRIYGHLLGLLTTLKSLPLAYNKDMQEDKEGMFDTVDQVSGALQLMAPMMATLIVRKVRMRDAVRQDFSNATDLADYLVTKGIPFRQAHETIGKLVLHCIQHHIFLLDVPLETYRAFAPEFTEEVYAVLQPEHVVNARNSLGGTAFAQVREALNRTRVRMQGMYDWMEAQRPSLHRAQALLGEA